MLPLNHKGNFIFIATICHLWHNTYMKFGQLLTLVGEQPLFETDLLLAGDVDPNDVRRQLSRWVRSGRIRQLRRGLYTLAPPYQNVDPHPFLIANALVLGSYVSLQSALTFYGFIPEYAPRTISVTMSRTSKWGGGFQFHHLTPHLFFGYQLVDLSNGQQAFVATPEKALLDLAHLTPKSDSPDYLSELRLQNLERLNLPRLYEFADRSEKLKWRRVATQIEKLALHEKTEYEELA
jgi:predicted transcriptional regulator of viral defense system